jgi:predicted protein tyrosine phosphatase
MSQSGSNRVAPKLWMGSKPPAVAAIGRVFDVVVLCAQPDEWQPPDGSFGRARILRCPMDDSAPTPDEVSRAVGTAQEVATITVLGGRVLVTCFMGWNRSGLVTALALRMRRYSAEQAIAAIRAARGPNALSNKHFVQVIEQFVPVTHKFGRRLIAVPTRFEIPEGVQSTST